ncbi:MAG: hypothetical protein LBL41_04105 [Bifidobacteriaceae bacterium]|jgi:hypothetical protein|nr:hypothetical protein [Bifidobacteriaceae bacterium]
MLTEMETLRPKWSVKFFATLGVVAVVLAGVLAVINLSQNALAVGDEGVTDAEPAVVRIVDDSEDCSAVAHKLDTLLDGSLIVNADCSVEYTYEIDGEKFTKEIKNFGIVTEGDEIATVGSYAGTVDVTDAGGIMLDDDGNEVQYVTTSRIVIYPPGVPIPASLGSEVDENGVTYGEFALPHTVVLFTVGSDDGNGSYDYYTRFLVTDTDAEWKPVEPTGPVG